MRLDDVEIKVNFSRAETPRALQALDLQSDGQSWQIYFCEDVNAGDPRTPLLDLGVVLRARVRPDDDDDATIKLRPCRGSQLTDRWFKNTEALKVEADWAGDRHVLAASHTAKRPKSVVPAVVAGQRPLSSLFTDQQEDFLSDCAGATVNLDTLTVLPPVSANRWKKVPAAPPELGLRAERWTVGQLDFLELSLVAPIDEALGKQAALDQFIGSLGLPVSQEQEPKTMQVLQHLVHGSLVAH